MLEPPNLSEAILETIQPIGEWAPDVDEGLPESRASKFGFMTPVVPSDQASIANLGAFGEGVPRA